MKYIEKIKTDDFKWRCNEVRKYVESEQYAMAVEAINKYNLLPEGIVAKEIESYKNSYGLLVNECPEHSLVKVLKLMNLAVVTSIEKSEENLGSRR